MVYFQLPNELNCINIPRSYLMSPSEFHLHAGCTPASLGAAICSLILVLVKNKL